MAFLWFGIPHSVSMIIVPDLSHLAPTFVFQIFGRSDSLISAVNLLQSESPLLFRSFSQLNLHFLIYGTGHLEPIVLTSDSVHLSSYTIFLLPRALMFVRVYCSQFQILTNHWIGALSRAFLWFCEGYSTYYITTVCTSWTGKPSRSLQTWAETMMTGSWLLMTLRRHTLSTSI